MKDLTAKQLTMIAELLDDLNVHANDGAGVRLHFHGSGLAIDIDGDTVEGFVVGWRDARYVLEKALR